MGGIFSADDILEPWPNIPNNFLFVLQSPYSLALAGNATFLWLVSADFVLVGKPHIYPFCANHFSIELDFNVLGYLG